ncbi:MAG: 50S ribosomal protein L17 [Alphaproteobacteria bacterium]|nr:50S ribosomal protein L17 [Alphaproteobacteria bacterium]
MRHGNRGRRFSRRSDHRKSMLENLAASLIKHEQITTTLHKAKDLRPFVEKLITLGKRGGLHARRQAHSALGEAKVTDKLFSTIAERYKTRAGGYTRIVRAGFRHGDAAAMALIELIDRDPAAKGTDAGPTKDAAKKAVEAEAAPAAA